MDKNTSQIRAELKRLIKKKKRLCKTEAEKNKAVNDSRAEINKKYGSDWRSKSISTTASKYKEPSIYEGHVFGEHWIQ